MKKHALGIDLGTTYSSVGLFLSENLEIVADKASDKYIPSLVNFKQMKNRSDLEITVGRFAKKRELIAPKNTIYDTKRMLGRRFKDKQIKELKKKWPFQIEESKNSKISICLNGIDKKLRPYEISGEILKYLAKIGNERLPEEEKTKDIVITVPANFGDKQRLDTLKAAEYAGLNVLTIINEPTAAGLAFGLHKENLENSYVFVFDFGGGTLDVSLLNINGNDIIVKATDGDMFLGGRDFDENTIEYLIREMKIDPNYYKNPKNRVKFRELVIEAKIQLSNTDSATIISDDDDFEEYEFSLSEFEEANQDLIDRIFPPIERLLKSSKIDKTQISSILLVGGSSHMQFVKRKLTEYFGKEPYSGVDPRDAVAAGASYLAAKCIEDPSLPQRIKDLQFRDICSHSYGTSDSDGSMTVFIKKGTPIPASTTETFRTLYYKQTIFTVDVFEGKNKIAKKNNFLGDFCIKNLPEHEKALYFDITFSLDERGILTVSAQLKNGDLNGEIQIDTEMIGRDMADEEEEEEEEEDGPNKREIIVFYENMERFVRFNKTDLLNYYSQKWINIILKELKKRITNVNYEYRSLKIIVKEFKKKFDLYLSDHKEINFTKWVE